jgi:hypothetical protein
MYDAASLTQATCPQTFIPAVWVLTMDDRRIIIDTCVRKEPKGMGVPMTQSKIGRGKEVDTGCQRSSITQIVVF